MVKVSHKAANGEHINVCIETNAMIEGGTAVEEEIVKDLVAEKAM